MVQFAENGDAEKERIGTVVESSETPIPSDGDKSGKDAAVKKEKRRRRKAKTAAGADGEHKTKKKRRNSLSKAPRDPRDGVDSPTEVEVGTRSPSPVIDFDGLSKPSKLSLCHS